MRHAVLLCGFLAVNALAQAETVPMGMRADARIKNVAYNADDVVKVVGHYGYSTDIVFAAYEEIENLAAGDSVAWEIAPVGNHLFVKPRESNAVTNMTVVTNRRTYEFSLDAREAKVASRADDSSMFFQVRFRYPDDEAALLKAETETHRKEAESARMQAILDAPAVPRNWDYWACGKRDLWPTEVYDDGRFTYLRFPNSQELPAVFMTNADGTESLANGGMHGDQYVMQVTTRKIVLRKGQAIACITNRSFDPRGVSTSGGTTNPALQRKTRQMAPRAEDIPLAPTNAKTAATNNTSGQRPTPSVPPAQSSTQLSPSVPPPSRTSPEPQGMN
jgi:type IV secretion system protein VirB9